MQVQSSQIQNFVQKSLLLQSIQDEKEDIFFWKGTICSQRVELSCVANRIVPRNSPLPPVVLATVVLLPAYVRRGSSCGQ